MEKTPEIKLIALDMDGTLLTSDDTIADETHQAIRQALAKGVHVVLSTGRGFQTCYPFAESLGLTSYLVTANGGQIWTVEKELLEQHLLPSEIVEKLWNLGQHYGMHMWIIGTDHFWRGDRPEQFAEHQFLKVGYDSEDLGQLGKLADELAQFSGLEVTNSLPHNLEVNPIGVSKAFALDKLCAKIGITMENVMAVGDSLNDLKAIQQAGIGVAMGNAQDKIKEAADFTTDINDADGVGKAIRRFVLEK